MESLLKRIIFRYKLNLNLDKIRYYKIKEISKEIIYILIKILQKKYY